MVRFISVLRVREQQGLCLCVPVSEQPAQGMNHKILGIASSVRKSASRSIKIASSVLPVTCSRHGFAAKFDHESWRGGDLGATWCVKIVSAKRQMLELCSAEGVQSRKLHI